MADEGDNAHPSGKDRSVEKTWWGTANPNQGKSESDPDDNHGPRRRECGDDPRKDPRGGCTDKPNGSGGNDLADQDGNNGCGNDDDFDDDNNGWCGKPQAPPPPPPPEKDRVKSRVPIEMERPPVLPKPPVLKPKVPVEFGAPAQLPVTGPSNNAPGYIAAGVVLVMLGTALMGISRSVTRRNT